MFVRVPFSVESGNDIYCSSLLLLLLSFRCQEKADMEHICKLYEETIPAGRNEIADAVYRCFHSINDTEAGKVEESSLARVKQLDSR